MVISLPPNILVRADVATIKLRIAQYLRDHYPELNAITRHSLVRVIYYQTIPRSLSVNDSVSVYERLAGRNLHVLLDKLVDLGDRVWVIDVQFWQYRVNYIFFDSIAIRDIKGELVYQAYVDNGSGRAGCLRFDSKSVSQVSRDLRRLGLNRVFSTHEPDPESPYILSWCGRQGFDSFEALLTGRRNHSCPQYMSNDHLHPYSIPDIVRVILDTPRRTNMWRFYQEFSIDRDFMTRSRRGDALVDSMAMVLGLRSLLLWWIYHKNKHGIR